MSEELGDILSEDLGHLPVWSLMLEPEFSGCRVRQNPAAQKWYLAPWAQPFPGEGLHTPHWAEYQMVKSEHGSLVKNPCLRIRFCGSGMKLESC